MSKLIKKYFLIDAGNGVEAECNSWEEAVKYAANYYRPNALEIVAVVQQWVWSDELEQWIEK